MADSSQKFIARNRAPRVQIEYDVELYGSEKKVQLPFVMGVMTDLAGKSTVEQPAVADRKFLEIDVDNFDERMKALAPRAAFTVPNTLTGEGNLAVDLTFESMADFSPGAIAGKVEALRPLLEARTQLQNLMAYMDGKARAETLIETILNDPALLAAVSAPAGDTDSAAALDSLRDVELPEEEADATDNVLSGLAAQAPDGAAAGDASLDVLEGLRADVPEEAEPEDASADVLEDLSAAAPAGEEKSDKAGAALASLAAAELSEAEEEDQAGSVLEGLVQADLREPEEEDTSSDVLAGLAVQDPVEEAGDTAGSALESLSAAEVPEAEGEDPSGVLDALAEMDVPETADSAAEDALESLAEVAVEEQAEEDHFEALDALADAGEAETEETAADDALGTLTAIEAEGQAEEDHDGILGGLAEQVPDEAVEKDAGSAALGSLALEEVPAAGAADGAEAADGSDDVLEGLLEAGMEEEADEDLSAVPDGFEAPEEADTAEDVLAGLGALDDEDESDDLSATLDTLHTPAEEEAEDSGLDDLLEDLGSGAPEELAEDNAEETDGEDLDLGVQLDSDDDAEETAGADDLDDLFGDLTGDEPEKTAGEEAEDSSLDDLLGSLDGDDSAESEDAGDDDLDGLLGSLDEEDAGAAADASLDDLLGDLGSEDEDGDLDDLLAGLGEQAAAEEAVDATDAEDDLDALLGGLGDADSDLDDLMGDDGDMDLDDLLGELGGDEEDAGDAGGDGLDDLLGDLDEGSDEPAAAAGAEIPDEPEFAYGTMSAERPAPQKLQRKRFRLAILGDFSGRAAKGQLETGDGLAARKATLLDPDTVEDVIESFATELVLPIGKEGAGIAVKLKDLDGLHPDELYQNVELFSELVGLRKQLQSGSTADHAANTLKAWAERHGTRARAPKRSSAGSTVPADKRLSAFQQLIEDTGITPRAASPVEELLARVVGPHIRAVPDPDTQAMQKAVDEALSDAMRLVLHHPEFQSVEAQWRSLDLISRSTEDDDTLDVMLYDISAEELAADLAAEEDLSKTGFARLLTEDPLDEDNGRGGYSALIGMYQFEETPPHAELLGRIARVAAHVDAPFFAAISPEFLKTPKAERPKLVADAWDTLQGMAEAGHLGLVSPRFLLRRPYGEKTEPCYEFGFEEFTEAEGLKGMLWANPVVLVAILLARSFRENGPSLQLGKIMTLGGMPYHYVNDRFGDQVALPCTERNIDLNKIALAQERGFMAVSAVKGRDELRLTSFNSLKGSGILGPWTGLPAPEPSPPDPRGLPKPAVPAGDEEDDLDVDLSGDDGDDFDLDDLGPGDGGDDDDDLGDLDDLLSSFGEDGDDDDGDDDEMDADLAALLDDL